MGDFNFAQYRTMLNVIRHGEEHDSSNTTDELLGQSSKKMTAMQKRAVGAVILIVLCVFLFFAGYSSAASDLTIEKVFLIMIAMLVVMVVIMGFYQAVSMLYFVKDMSFYLALPIPPFVIMAAKMTYFLLSQVVINCVIIAFGVGFLAGRGADILSYVFLILSFIPCVIATALALIIIVIPVMRFSRVAADKDKFARVFGVLTTVVSMLIAAVISVGMRTSSDTSAVMASMGNVVGSGISSIILAIICAPTLLVSQVFEGNIALGLIGMYALAAVYVVVMGVFAKLWYFEGVRGMQDGGGKKSHKQYSQTELAGAVKMRSQFKAFLSQDITSLIRVPAFFQQFVFQTLIEPIVVMVLACVTIYMRDGEGAGELAALITGASLGDNSFLPLIIATMLLGLLGTFPSYMNTFALGRDGQDFFFLRAMPLNMKQYVQAKFVSTWLLSRVPVFVILLIALVVVGVGIDMALVAVLVFALPMTAIDLILFCSGSKNPNLTWENETEFIKQSSMYQQAFIAILGGIAAYAVPAIIMAALFYVGASSYVCVLTVLVVCVLEFGLAFERTNKVATRNMELVQR